VRHALKNALGTAACFFPFASIATVTVILIADFMAHYHIDFFKVNLNKSMGWGPTAHAEFWRLTGLDQFFHQVTYLALIWITIR